MKKITRIGVGGPVGSGKTAIIEAVTPVLIRRGIKRLIITNDVVTTEDAKHVQRELDGILEAEKIVGVETGACPHTAIREDPSMNLAAVEELESKFPDSDLIFIESGGDNRRSLIAQFGSEGYAPFTLGDDGREHPLDTAADDGRDIIFRYKEPIEQ